ELEKIIPELRQKLPQAGRGLLSLETTPPGAVVYAVTEQGSARGIGVSPLVKHPLATSFTRVRVVLPGRPPLEERVSLEADKEATLSLSFDAPPKAEEAKAPPPKAIEEEAPPSAVAAPSTTTGRDAEKKPASAYVLLGTGGVALAVGGVFTLQFFQTVK